MRRPKLYSLAVALAIAAGAMSLTACVESDPDAADTPDSAPTIANTAIQTDEEGMTVTEEAPAPDDGGGEQPMEGGGEMGGEAVEAGQAVFNENCTTCHAQDGIGAGPIGPNLEGVGLSTDEIESVIVNGQGAMPGGLVSGEELDQVVAYVESIQ